MATPGLGIDGGTQASRAGEAAAISVRTGTKNFYGAGANTQSSMVLVGVVILVAVFLIFRK